MYNSQVNNVIKTNELDSKKILITIMAGLLFGFFILSIDGKNLKILKVYQPSLPTVLYDIKGRPFAELYIQKSEIIPLERVPPTVIQTFIIVEDSNFYRHIGFDIFGIIRAIFKNILSGKIVQGGSTLTQQVSKMLYLNVYKERKRTFLQKFKELILALKLEQNLSKEEILELYLNMVYFGHGCEGIDCASKIYFNKNVENLSIGEAALLARLPKSPVEYSPFKYPENARSQHSYILSRLVSEDFLTKKEAEDIFHRFWDKYWGYFITTSPSTNIRKERLDLAPYFTKYVETILKNEPSIDPDLLYSGGFKIYTTLDLDLQLIAQEEMNHTLMKADEIGRVHALEAGKKGVDLSLFDIHDLFSLILPIGKPNITQPTPKQILNTYLENHLLDGLQLLTLGLPASNENNAFDEVRKRTLSFSHNLHVEGALLSIEHTTGGIKAMIGGREFSSTNQFNRALFAKRQPGSAFKIFVYGSAIEYGFINSMSPLSDTPIQVISDDGTVWSPGNYAGEYYGLVPAALALAYSLNPCSVDLYFKVGPGPIVDFAKKLMKITNPYRLRSEPSIALGAYEITPKELAVATAIIANQGKEVIPYAIRYVKNANDEIIYSQEEIVKYNLSQKILNGEIQVIHPGTSYILRTMLQQAVDHGTLRMGIREIGNYKGDVAGKTGTTSSWSDAWVTAFNPEFTFTLWFGFDRSSITLGPGQAGGSVAAPTLGRILSRYYKQTNKKPPMFDSERPDDVVEIGCGLAIKTYDYNKSNLQEKKPSLQEYICSIDGRVQTQEDLIMKELNIKPEDLGIKDKKKIRFLD